MDAWPEFEPVLRQRMNDQLTSDPEVLFECDGGPVGMTADIVLARLIGYDDEIVDDTLRLDRVRPEWLVPIPERLPVVAADPEPYRPPRTARYVLQSGYARMSLDPTGFPLPPGVRPSPPDFLVSVVFVRYRRRS